MARVLFRGAVIAAAPGVAVGLLHAAGVGPIPVLDTVLLGPGAVLTWIVLGDGGTDREWRWWSVGLSAALYAALGGVVSAIVRSRR